MVSSILGKRKKLSLVHFIHTITSYIILYISIISPLIRLHTGPKNPICHNLSSQGSCSNSSIILFALLGNSSKVPLDGITKAADVMTKSQHPTFLSTEIIVVNASRASCCSNDFSFMWKTRYQIPHPAHFHPLSWCPFTFTCTQIQLSLQEKKIKLETEEDRGAELTGTTPASFMHIPTSNSGLCLSKTVWSGCPNSC